MFCFIFYENNYNFVIRALLFYTISFSKKITWINEKNKKKVLMCLLIKQTQKKKKKKELNEKTLIVRVEPKNHGWLTQIETARVYLQAWKSLSINITYLLQPAL